MHIRLIIFFLFLFSFKLKAQETISYSQIEAKSMELYFDEDWNQLISFSQKIIQSGTDYYALHLRMSIAFFQQGKYRKAASEFEKTLKFNSYDQLALEYLYYSNLFSGNYTGAKLVTRRFDQNLLKKTKESTFNPITDLRLEGGTRFISSTNAEVGKINFYELGTGQQINKRISVAEAFSILTQDKVFSYTDSYTNVETKTTVALNQKQFYAALNYQITPSLNLTPTFHLLKITVDQSNNQPGSSAIITINNDFATGIMLSKRFAHFSITPFATYSSLNDSISFDSIYTQKGASISYFPFANNKLCYTSTFNYHKSPGNSGYPVYRQALSVAFGKAFLSLEYCKGNEVINIANSNTYLLNNSLDITNYKLSGLFSFDVNPKINLYAYYQFEDRQRPEKKTEAGYTIYPNLNYKFTTLLTGLKIKF